MFVGLFSGDLYLNGWLSCDRKLPLPIF